MTTKNKRSGRSFLGTLFLVGMGFLTGMFLQEIVSFAKTTVQSISH